MERYLLPEPLPATGNLPEQWARFKRQFELFIDASEKSDARDKAKIAMLLRTIGDKGNDIFENFVFTPGANVTLSDVIAKFDEFCKPRVSVFAARHQFLTMKQNNLSIDEFVTALRKQVRDCTFGELTDDMVLHALTLGLNSEKTRRRLFESQNLTLEKAITLCRITEDTEEDMRKLKLNEEVSAVYKTKPKARPKAPKTKTPMNTVTGQVKSKICSRCGTSHAAKQCPAYGKECHICKKPHHFARCCRTTKTPSTNKRVYRVEADETDSDSTDILHIQVDKVGRKLMATIRVHPEGNASTVTQLRCQLDTAATCNVLSVNDYNKLGSPQLQLSTTTLTMYDGTQVLSQGRCYLQMSEVCQNQTLMFELVETKHATLLSLDTCLQLDLISVKESVHLIEEQSETNVENVITKYADVFTGMGCLPGEYDIIIDKDVPPVQNRPRRVAYALKDDFQKKIIELEKQGVIAKVDTPTPWISNCLAVRKPNGSVRVCLDPSDLNRAIRRNHYQLPVIEEVLPTLKDAKIFSLVDAKDGFLQVKLSEASSYLTSFWTPAGKFRWLRMPFGLSSSPEEFQRRLQQALEGLDGISTVADDILIVGRGKTEAEARQDHDRNFVNLLQRAHSQNLKLNKAKMRLHMKEIAYIGHVLSPEGVKADPDKVADIKSMPTPTDAEEVRRFLGFTNYLAKFLPNLSAVSEPLRRLVQKDTEFEWGPSQQQAFLQIKDIASAEHSLAYYDVNKPIVVQCDASTRGLGATLLQDEKPVAYASRSLTKSEQNYAPIELECLAIVFACRKYDQYIYGHSAVTIHSDHKPLEAIFKKSMLEAPKRLQRMLLALQRYDLNVVYKPGREQLIADMLSRAPSSRKPLAMMTKEQIFQLLIGDSLAEEVEAVDPKDYVHIAEPRIQMIREATTTDKMLQQLMGTVMTGWPEHKHLLPPILKVFWDFRDVIAAHNGILYKGDRMIIPKAVQKNMLSRLHSSHQGIEATLRRARDSIYWQGMTNDIKEMVERCEVCAKERPAQRKETLRSHDIPPMPWAKVGMDLFTHKMNTYLIIVDYYSDYFEFTKLSDQRADTSIQACKEQFARHGVPQIVHSDGGPQFISAEFQQFAKSWEFQHSLSSPYHSQSNGKAESAVKIAKAILKKAADPMKALLEWRNTPTSQIDSSPVQRLMQRRTRATVPQAVNLLKPALHDGNQTVIKKAEKQRQSQRYYNRGACDLRPIQKGTPVFVQSLKKYQQVKWSPGTIVDKCSDRSYVVDVEGQLLRRNRRYLREDNTTPQSLQSQLTRPESQHDTSKQPDHDRRAVEISANSKTTENNEPYDMHTNSTSSQEIGITSPVKADTPVKTRSGRIVIKPARFR